MDRRPDSISADSASRSAPVPSAGVPLPLPPVATPPARLASEDYGPFAPPKPDYRRWLVGSILGWTAFAAFLVATSWVLILIVRLCAGIFQDSSVTNASGLGQAIGAIVSFVLLLVMITATLLTMADRKWSALMQDRVGPNRARLSILPGRLKDMPLKGLPHIAADVLKMLFKEDFIPEGAEPNKLLFNLAPLLSFAPAFCLFAIVPVGPDVTLWGHRVSLQVARVDWGILYVFALASVAVFGTALAGWTSNNKLALLGGLRASAQLVSYEVTLGLTLVGAFIVFGSLRLEDMVKLQGVAEASLRTAAQLATREGRLLVGDDSLLFGWLPSWGIVFQPLGALLFLVAALAEIKRAPFDTPEGESEIIGYFLEYSGLKSGLFLIAEYAETVVVSGIIVSIFLGGYHIPWLEPTLYRIFDGAAGASGFAWLAVFQVFTFIVKMLAVIWLQFLIRWAFPRFRYDQVMRLGWKMMLPVSLANVVISGAVFLWAGKEGLAWMGGIEWVAILAFVAFKKTAQAPADAGAHSSTAGAH
jgi:NADH-quinone oxidoreductase subunit H